MDGDLLFPLDEVEALARHALNAPQHTATLQEQRAFLLHNGYATTLSDADELIYGPGVPESFRTGAPGLMLIVDAGVYIASTGLPGKTDPVRGVAHHHVVHAEGLKPGRDPGWRRRQRDVFGDIEGYEKLLLPDCWSAIRAFRDQGHLLARLRLDASGNVVFALPTAPGSDPSHASRLPLGNAASLKKTTRCRF